MTHAPTIAALAIMLGAGVACTSTPPSPTSPSATVGAPSAANADGSTLKVSAPAIVSPTDGERVSLRRPTFVWLNSRGENVTVALAYELVVVDGADNVVYEQTVGAGTGAGSHTTDSDLPLNAQLFWRARAAVGTDKGPWSVWGSFLTPEPPPPPPTSPTGGVIGPRRSISFAEAFNIILNIHNGGRFNLGGSSTRDYRVAFIFGAVAAIHYGHARWNPQGPDTDWCVKDAGAGRPPSDDVLVRCSTREAWDLISGAGANGYGFHPDYLGSLPSSQNVYAPPRGALGVLPQ